MQHDSEKSIYCDEEWLEIGGCRLGRCRRKRVCRNKGELAAGMHLNLNLIGELGLFAYLSNETVELTF